MVVVFLHQSPRGENYSGKFEAPQNGFDPHAQPAAQCGMNLRGSLTAWPLGSPPRNSKFKIRIEPQQETPHWASGYEFHSHLITGLGQQRAENCVAPLDSFLRDEAPQGSGASVGTEQWESGS